MQPLQLNALIEENLRLLEVAIPKQVRLEAELAGRLPLIQADAGQMQQVLMNLIINGAEAIGTRPGTVRLRTGVRGGAGGAGSVAAHGRGDVGGALRGVGGEGRRQRDGFGDAGRILDPFFTTKFTGRGLGLAAVLGIVSGHRGGLRVESTPGRGTVFSVVLPALGAGGDGGGGGGGGRARLGESLVDAIRP